MSPLEIIKNWLDTLDEETQIELVFLFGFFHPDETISKEAGIKQVKAFKRYLSIDKIYEKEVVARAVLSIGFIDLALASRNSEEGWTQAIDSHLSMAAKFKEKGLSTETSDRFFENLDDNKKKWFKIDANWEALKSTELTKNSIYNWFYFQTFKSK